VGDVSGVWIPIVLVICVAVVLCSGVYFNFLSRTEYQKTVRTVIERGQQQLTPEFLERLSEGRGAKAKDRDLRIGVVSVALGLGIGSFGLLIGESDAVRPFIAIGNVPALIGLALIGLWKFGPRD
jgi:hypothetical protein